MSNGNAGNGLQQSLPTVSYLSPEIFAQEKERIFFREWICAGREEQLLNPGDSLVLDVLGESVLVVRSKNGQLKAHYNVCRHRGSRLCNEDAHGVKLIGGVTAAGTIRCPYHLWTYSLDGELLSAPHLREADGLDKKDFSLYPVGIESLGGFFFLNLTPADATRTGHNLARQLGPIPERVKRYPLAELRSARKLTYEVAANWKVIMENYNECYHCAGVHPELCRIVPAFKEKGGSNLDWDSGIPQAEGTFTFTMTGTSDRAPFPGLDEQEQVRHKGELVYPN